MYTRTTLYEQISNFENAIESFNNILACFDDGEIEMHEEISAIKEKLIASLKKDNIELPVETIKARRFLPTACFLFSCQNINNLI